MCGGDHFAEIIDAPRFCLQQVLSMASSNVLASRFAVMVAMSLSVLAHGVVGQQSVQTSKTFSVRLHPMRM